jgi:hypothetical protein
VTLRWFPGAAALVSSLALAACGGGARATTTTTAPVASPRETVSAFLAAAADSNLARMGALWGTARGAAARTGQPQDWERRVYVMQTYLRNTTHQIVAEDKGLADNQRIVQVKIRREDCEYMVPFTTIRDNQGGWLVNAFDVRSAGAPGRPCNEQPKG